jgi:hypothetical protein
MLHEHPMPGQVLMITPDLVEDYLADDPDAEPPRVTTDLAQATTTTSQMAHCPDMHRPVLDLDMPCRLIPSSTPGHFHLYIDRAMTWETYAELLGALSKANIIEPGYAGASLARGYTRVRLPWVRKEVRDPAPLPAPEQARAGVMDGAL